MLNDELRNLFNGKRKRINHPKWNKFPITGKKFIKEINNLNCNLVLDLGCGQNPYKGRINNLIGIDILDNHLNDPLFYQDLYCDIKKLPFKDNVADIVIAFGSINFGDDEVIDSQLREAIRVLKEGGRFYFRGIPKFDHKLYYNWTIEKLIEKTEKFNLEFFIEPQIIYKTYRKKEFSGFDIRIGRTNERIYCAWIK